MKRLPSGALGNRVVNLWGVFCARVREFSPEPRPVSRQPSPIRSTVLSPVSSHPDNMP